MSGYGKKKKKNIFWKSLKNYALQKKKKEEMIALGTGRLWPIPLCYATVAPALLRQRSVIKRSRPEVI